jgi:alpha-L-rhamnosidase
LELIIVSIAKDRTHHYFEERNSTKMKSNQAITEIRVEHFEADALGIGTGSPRLSWTYDRNAELSTAGHSTVRIRAQRSLRGNALPQEEVTVPASRNILLPWPFEPVQTGEQVVLSARLTSDRNTSAWSPERMFEPGLLDLYEKSADMVGPSWYEPGSDHRHAPLVRAETDLRNKPVWARLYLSAYGLVEAEINGSRVGEDVLTPGWTDYRNRLEFWTFDVTNLLHEGDNALGFLLGDGWYRGRIGWDGGEANFYGERLGVWAQLEVTFADGTSQSIRSNSYDGKWKAAKGPIVESGLYEGEQYDARLSEYGWSEPGFIPSERWSPVQELKLDPQKLQAPEMDPVRKIGSHAVQSVQKISNGSYLLDFGQNCTQRLELNIPPFEPGHRVTIRHAEVLEKDGSLSLRPLRRASQEDVYISDGHGATWEPRFTIHGFRYAQIDGWDEDSLDTSDITCHVYGSHMKRRGWFTCSHDMINQLHSNVRWSTLSNFVSIPTDCPQRDERLGWTGDIAVFAPTASFLYDTSAFLSNWLIDVADETKKLGSVPGYVPFIPLMDWRGPIDLAIWGDSAVLVPWAIYQESGDTQMLARHYPLCRFWIEHVSGLLSDDGVWNRPPNNVLGQLGDWLDPTAPVDNPTQAMTQKELVATAFFGRSTSLVAQMAEDLGNSDDTRRYRHLAEHIKRGFVNAFILDDGTMTSDTESAYALAIAMGFLDDSASLKHRAGERLASLAEKNNYRIATGFAGTPFVLPALSETGHSDVAYKMLLTTDSPSWMYEVAMGGTTIWERWDAMLPDGSLNPGDMTSFNHYAFGSVAEWIHTAVGGIKATAPGWTHFIIDPQPGGGVTSAHVQHATPHGMIDVEWQITEDGDTRIMSIIPWGTTATMRVDGVLKELHAGRHVITRSTPTHH